MRKGLWLSILVVAGVTGCDAAPRNAAVEWVTRDAWDVGCAHAATVETFKVNERGWKVKGEVYSVDVDATFKLINPCDTGAGGKSYKQFESVKFSQKDIEMVLCEREGVKGWALQGMADSRCWTGPTPPSL